MTLRQKLLLAQAPMLAALVLLGIVAIATIGRLGGNAQTILQDNYRSVLAAQRMKEAGERMDSAALFKLNGEWARGATLAAQNRKTFENELRVEEGNITEPGEGDAARRLRAQWMDYQKIYDQFSALRDPAAEHTLYFDMLYPSFLVLKQSADDILNLNQDAMRRKGEHVRQVARGMNTFMLLSTMAAILLAFGVSTWLTARLLRPLAVLTQAARRIGEGDLDARANVPGADEIARLATEFNAMADHLARFRLSSLGELLQAQQTTQATIDSLPDPVVVFGLDGRVINANLPAESTFGLSIDTGGRQCLDHLTPVLRETLERVRGHVLAGRGPWQPKGFDEALRVPAGAAERWYLVRATPLHDEEGAIMGVTAILQDVTRLHRFDELKTDLVATVAHEFRTPLTSLHMAIHLCLDETVGQLNEKQQDLLFAARGDCERLQTMVEDLLDLSRIQSGRVEMRRRPVTVHEMLEAAAAQHRPAIQEHDLSLTVEEETVPGATVQADPERLGLVLANFITNAIRHTPAGGRLTLRARPADGRVRFEVTDTGEGITPEHLPRIFDKFYRVPGAATGGAGLGLSISREIVEAHGGQIGAASQPGEGSTFWFDLPK